MTSELLGLWVHKALAGGTGRKLIVVQDSGFEYLAILDFGDLRMRYGKHASTPDHALFLLNNELEAKKDMWEAIDKQTNQSPWVCPRCGQKNVGWVSECGRCQRMNF